jgi:hypothetical protein
MTWGVRLIVAGDWCSLWFLCLCRKIDGIRFTEIRPLEIGRGEYLNFKMFFVDSYIHDLVYLLLWARQLLLLSST